VIAMVVVFGKNEKGDLNSADRRKVSEVVETFRAELESEFRRDRQRDPGQEQGGRR